MKHKNFWIGTSVLSLGVVFFGLTVFAVDNTDFNWMTGLPSKTELEVGKSVKATHPQAFRQALLNLNQRAWEYDAANNFSYFLPTDTNGNPIPDAKVGIGTNIRRLRWVDTGVI